VRADEPGIRSVVGQPSFRSIPDGTWASKSSQPARCDHEGPALPPSLSGTDTAVDGGCGLQPCPGYLGFGFLSHCRYQAAKPGAKYPAPMPPAAPSDRRLCPGCGVLPANYRSNSASYRSQSQLTCRLLM